MWAVMLALALEGASPPSLDQLVDRVQSHYDRLQDFEAQFTQRHVRRIIHKVVEERGTMAFKKPDLMRWEYQSPENKLFVSDGTKTYFYVPEDHQVIVSHTAGGAMGPAPDSPLALIMGRTRLLDTFEVVESDSEPQSGGRVLRLIPRRPQEDFEQAEIEVRPEDGQVRRVILLDNQGNRSEFIFEDIRENRGLSDALFHFTIPSGVDILLAPDSSPPSPLN